MSYSQVKSSSTRKLEVNKGRVFFNFLQEKGWLPVRDCQQNGLDQSLESLALNKCQALPDHDDY